MFGLGKWLKDKGYLRFDDLGILYYKMILF